MNTLSTNTITNVYNVGTSSCDAGTKYCTNEYALYFPCLKDVTRGQNVCFDFYIADGSTQDVVDLRTVDAITLNLNGQFNCSYGSFSYPDNITSLQKEDYSQVYHLDFKDSEKCNLTVYMVDKDSQDVLNKIGDECGSDPVQFWSGTTVRLKAEDTLTHIFVGWAIVGSDDDCPDDSLEDYIIDTNKEFSFTITEDTVITAVYRARKRYNVVSDSNNLSSHFKVLYVNSNGDIVISKLSNRDDGYPDGEDVIEGVMEGHELVALCIPSGDRIDANSNPGDDKGWRFKQWKDGNTERCRTFIIGDVCGTAYFEDGDTIRLKAICDGPFDGYVEPDVDEKFPNNIFDEEGIHIDYPDGIIETYDYKGDGKYIKNAEDVQKCVNDEGYLYVNSGKLVLSSEGIENGIKIDIHAQSGSNSDSEPCELIVRINDYAIGQEIDDIKNYSFYFTKCNGSDIEIYINGECIIDDIIVYKEILIDGGKAQFCLDAETTSSIPPGPLFVNGAIAVGELGIDENGDIVVVDPQSYGLATTPIGQVNKLPKININIE